MVRHFWAYLLLTLLVSLSWGQSASDLAQKFRHHEVYEVEPGVVMSAEFGASGLVCEMHVEQTRFGEHVIALTNGIDFSRIDALLDRIVPASERGAKDEDDVSGLGKLSGSTMTKTDTYANVTVRVISRFETHEKSVMITGPTVLEIKWRNRSCR